MINRPDATVCSWFADGFCERCSHCCYIGMVVPHAQQQLPACLLLEAEWWSKWTLIWFNKARLTLMVWNKKSLALHATLQTYATLCRPLHRCCITKWDNVLAVDMWSNIAPERIWGGGGFIIWSYNSPQQTDIVQLGNIPPRPHSSAK